MYNYTRKSLIDYPINYSYSSYDGDTFLKDWQIHRSSYLEELSQLKKLNYKNNISPELPFILKKNGEKDSSINEESLCNLLLRKYESTKKIYSRYINNKPVEASGSNNIEDYISTAILIERFYSESKDIRYLNCLLKLCDLFQSDKRFNQHFLYIKELISKELTHITELLDEKDYINAKEYENSEGQLMINDHPKIIRGLSLICCNSSRSSIYLQSLINANIYPENIIYMKTKKNEERINYYPYEKLSYYPDWLFVPEAYVHPQELATKYNINFIQIGTSSINSNLIYESLKIIKPKLIIYCGFGGEIVSEGLIKNFRFIHCHAGTLPRFRGSTTFYYEILSKRLPSVSCILLDSTIDTGSILSIKSFPIPSKKDNIDTLYEPSIRANLLCDVLFNIGDTLDIKAKSQLNNAKQLNYYIIHPVLKHVSFSYFRD